ncbi:DUF3016 domain-containing protein [Kangiella spongicola]|uniref:DUF3016 domain-containing protein n=2 Tax=Kangiella spongicola TaxID=796379 RepID=A0A318D2X5_9GAMM|nr:DUF3016 domain-containing protein [Kangiella spongicola]
MGATAEIRLSGGFMKSYQRVIVSAIGVLALSWGTASMANSDKESKQSQAGIQVEWSDFNDYRDVRAASEPRGTFHKRVKKSFEKFFKEYSNELPEGQMLSIKILDLDLAGHVELGSTRDIRVMKDIHFPRMEFSYILTDDQGAVLKEGEANLKDMNYLHQDRAWKRARYKEGFYYEKRMFREWFEETLGKS